MPDLTSPPQDTSTPHLRKALGPVSLMLYGTGSMLGAGIYALVGKASASLGNAVWLAFLVAMVAALLTGLSYACIGSRYPRAAGAAYAAHRAFRMPWLTYVVGLAVVASGLASMAGGSRAIGDELVKIGVPGHPSILAAVYLVLLSLVVYRGIRESMAMNVVCTAIEVLGLLFVIAVGIRFWGSVNYLQGPPLDSSAATQGASGFAPITFTVVMSGAVLTFFSFIGFEDILNVSEETKNPRRDVPIGLIGAMLIATSVYLAVAFTAVSVGLPHAELVKEGLRGVVGKAAPWFPRDLFSYITIFAVANTALLNYVMGSRIVYGMAQGGLLPAPLAKIHVRRQTPHVAVFVLLGIVLVIMSSGHLSELAAATVLLLLSVFTVVNTGLILLKLRKDEPRGGFEVPIFVPALGALVCATLATYRVIYPPADAPRAVYIAGGLLVGIVALYLILRPKAVMED